MECTRLNRLVALVALATVVGAQTEVPACFSVILPGYSAPLCNVKVTVKLNRGKYDTPNFGTAYNRKMPGYPTQTHEEMVAKYTTVNNVLLQMPHVLTPYAEAGGALSTEYENTVVNHPIHCSSVCDITDSCAGFTFKFGQCIFSNAARSGIIQMPGLSYKYQGGEFITYWKSSSSARSSASPDQIAQFPVLKMFESSLDCDQFYSLGEPCFHDSVAAITSFASDDSFNDLLAWDVLLPLDDGNGGTWGGSSPGAFDPSKATVESGELVLETEHQDPTGSFAFPDTDCHCNYDTYTTGMVAGKTAVGYGVYEATFKSTATEFASSFWMQGDDSEINILSVENGVATVSWYCFEDQSSQMTKSYSVPGVDITEDTTATFSWNADEIIVLINGRMILKETTPSCMVNTQMKPIFSVEIGDDVTNLPSVQNVPLGGSFGRMTVNYFRQWAVTSTFQAPDIMKKLGVYANQVTCKGYNATGSQQNGGGETRRMGIYQGPTPPGRWTAVCGQRLTGSRKLLGYQYRNLNIAGCGARCDEIPGCSIFTYDVKRDCRMFSDFAVSLKYDVDVNQASYGSVAFYRSYQKQQGLYVPKPNTPPECADPQIPGMTTVCFSRPNGYGKLAAIDMELDGIIEFGCPYKSTEVWKNGKRNPKACKASICQASKTDCPTNEATGLEVLPTKVIHKAKWDLEFAATPWHGGPPLGELTIGNCVKMCSESCACMMASWDTSNGRCVLLSSASYRREQPAPKKRKEAPKWVKRLSVFIKDMNDPVNSYCDRDTLVANDWM